jgi:hypothetical protein
MSKYSTMVKQQFSICGIRAVFHGLVSLFNIIHVLTKGHYHLNGSGSIEVVVQLLYTLYYVVFVSQDYNSTMVNMHFTFN